MNTDELKLRLQSPEVKDNLKALLEIRTKTLKTKPGVKSLLKQNFVRDLVSLIEKPNSKVVDISLSILGNLLQEDAARAQIRSANGLAKLVQIVQNIEEESISCRAFRAIANAAQDQRNCKILHQHGVATLLAKCLSSATEVPNRLVLIRAVRIFGDSVEHKNYLATEGAVSAITNILAGAKPVNEADSSSTLTLLDPPSETCPNCGRPRGDDGTGLVCDGSDLLRPRHRRCEKSKSKTPEVVEEIEPEELSDDVLKAATKCMAKISHECEMDVAQVLLPGVKVLVDLVDHPSREVAANSLTTIINLTQVAGVRPSLGNVGSIKCLVEKYEKGDLTDKEGAHVITALCLYCRESVNRMRLRDLGGCRLFVNVLNDGSRSNLHDRVINSLLQFIYDNHSLNVFMNEGLIQSLVGFLEEHTEGNSVTHCCVAKEAGKEEQMETDADASEIEPTPKAPSPVCDMEPVVDEESDVPNEAAKQDVMINVKESEGKPEADGDRHVFRVTSPSYQAVQHELQQFLLLRSSRDLSNLPQDSPGIDWNPSSPGSSYCQSPDRSPISLSCGYSPDRSPRYFHSPNRSYSPSPSHSLPDSPAPSLGDYSPPSSPPYSPPEPSYSPIENFSDDEDSNPVQASTSTSESASSSHLIPPSSNASPESTSNEIFSPSSHSTAQPSSPPPTKKPRLSIPNYKYSPSLPSPSIKHCPPPVKRSAPTIGLEAINRSESEDSSSSGRISWVLQILSRLSQAERTHEQLTTRRTIHALINYMFKVPNSCPRAGRTVIRLTKNLYCLFPFILQRHMSWMYLALEDRCSLEVEAGCDSCRDLKAMVATIAQNLSLLAETGYAEGEMCHRLVMKSYSLEEKQAISISAPLLVRQRKMLQNVLLNHDSLEVMLEVLETETGDVFSHAVLSLSRLAGYLGVVSPDLTLGEDFTSNICCYNNSDHNVALVLDDESRITANKQHLSDSSSVFSAMLSGQFAESGQAEVRIQSSSLPAITCLVHFLYGCRWCGVFVDLGVDILLELVSLTDRFLLKDLNMAVSHEIIRRCMVGDNIIEIYKHSLQKEYPVRSADVTLSGCTVSTVLVGDMSTASRVRLVHLLMQSQLHQDFMDDVSKTIRGKLLQRM